MRGASREALAQAWSAVEAALASASTADAAQVGDELFGVVGVLDDQVALRRALSDPAIAAQRKAGLADSVLGARVNATTLEIVRGLVRSRWSRMRDLVDAVETVAVLARLIGADRAGAGERSDEVEDELFRFARIIENRPDLRDALANPGLPAANKVSLLHALLDGKATSTTVALVVQAVSRPRGRKPEEGLAEYGEIAARRTRRSIARVTAAVALSDDERSRLRAALAQMYGHDVQLQVEIDPAIAGGLVVRVDDEIVDGSIAGRLADARQRLT